jgi:membrane fusion protein, multidrug efflux system
VVQGNGKVELRAVTLGRDFGPTVEIVEGITAAEQVIINPPDSLVSGTSVRIAEAGKVEK